MDRTDLLNLAESTQHVLTPQSRQDLEMSRSAWNRLVRSDGIDRPFRSVAVLPGSPDRALTRARAALAAVQCPAMLTGWSAAHLHGLVTSAPTDVHLLTPHGASVTRRDGMRVSETSAWPRRRFVQGVAVAPVRRVLADLAPTTTADALLNVAIDARFAGLLRDGDLDAEVARRTRFPGRRIVRGVADLLSEDDSDSGFEHHSRDRLTAVGLPPDPGQHALTVAGRERRIDLPYVAHRVGVECLGLRAHSGRTAFDADAERRNDFAELGTWLVLDLTWTTFLKDWDRFVARLRRVLETRARH